MKKRVFILCLAICLLFVVSSVCASDVNDTVIDSEDSSQTLEKISEKPISSIDEINEELISQENNSNGLSKEVLNSEEIPNIEDLESNDEQSILSEPKTIYATTKTLAGIKNAISSASDGDTIILDGAYNCPSVDWVMRIEIDKKLNFVGINDAILTRTGSSGSGAYVPAFDVFVDDVSFKNIAFKDFYNKRDENMDDYGGGAIHSSRNLFIDNCTFINCEAATVGGAIGIFPDSSVSDSHISNSKFINCSSKNGGAIGIYSRYGSNVYIENSTFSNNYADNNGGNIYCGGLNLNMINCNFTGSYSTNGGSIYAEAAGEAFELGYIGQCALPSVTIDTCNFENNHATNNGGAISDGPAAQDLQISNSTFTNCHANFGGGIEWEYLVLSNVIFTNCSASENNTGAFYSSVVIFQKNCEFINSTYSSNEKEYDFNLYEVSNGTFTALQIKINNAEDGSTITLENDYIYDNITYDYENQISKDGITISKVLTIEGNGHRIDANGKIRIFNIIWQNYLTYSGIILKNLILVNGYSDQDGGAIYYPIDAGLTLINCSFYNNEAENGGAIYSTSHLPISDSYFINNTARTSGGAIYSTSHLPISDSYFINNTARNYGGGIYDAGNYFDITNNLFSNNTANEGGAIFLEGNVEKDTESAIARYDAMESGYYGYWYVAPTSGTDNRFVVYQNLIDAGILNYLTDDRISDRVQSLIDYYQSGKTGAKDYYVSTYFPEGYLWYDRDKLVPAGEGTIFKNIFINNNATEKGGAIYSTANNIVIKENRFINNSAGDESIIYLSNKTQIRTGIVDVETNNYYYKPVDSISFYIGERFKFRIYFNFCDLIEPKITKYKKGDIGTVVGYNVTLSNNVFEQNNAETTENIIINEGIDTTFENNINNGEVIITDPTNPSNPTEPQNPTNPSNPTEPQNPTNPSNPANPSNPINTNTQTSTTKTTLTLKKVTVKKSAKKLVITATLKINGKAVEGKIIKFKFNKKTYKAKTNKNGVAKITIKKAVLTKLKVGKKVTYTATYGKTTKKITVKIKK